MHGPRSNRSFPRQCFRSASASRFVRIPAVLFVCFACTRLLSAQSIQGTLVDDLTGQRIWAGTVTLLTEDSTEVVVARTNRGGQFTLDAPRSGTYRLLAERSGYTTLVSSAMELQANDTLHLQLFVSRDAVVLDPIVVTGRLSRMPGPLGEYYRRLESQPWGRFVTREQIDRSSALRTTDLLRTVPGVRLVGNPRSSGLSVVLRDPPCSPTVFVDGARVPMLGFAIDDLVHPSMLEGIEVYRNSFEVPPRYGLNVGCGAILLWTRRGP